MNEEDRKWLRRNARKASGQMTHAHNFFRYISRLADELAKENESLRARAKKLEQEMEELEETISNLKKELAPIESAAKAKWLKAKREAKANERRA